MLLPILFTLIAAPLQHAEITLDSGAIRLPLLLQNLSEYSDKPLAVNANLNDEVAFVNVHDRSLNEIKADLATTFRAEWIEKKDAIYLVRNSKIVIAGRKEETLRYGAAFREAFLSDTKGVTDFQWTAENAAKNLQVMEGWTKVQRPQFSLPIGKLFRHVIGSLDFNALASSPVNRTAIYSNHPNRLQKALPTSTEAMLKEYLREHGAVVSASISHESKEVTNASAVAKMFDATYEAVPLEPATIILRVIQTGRDRIHFHLSVYDRDGYRVGWMQMPFSPELSPSSRIKLPHEDMWGQDKVPFSELAVRLCSNLRVAGPILPAAERPDQREPLGIVLNDFLDKVSEKTGCDIIARVPDSASTLLYNQESLGKTMSQASDDYQEFSTFTVHDGLLLAEPRSPEECYDTRASRDAYKNLFHSAGTGMPELAAVLKFSTAQRLQTSGWFDIVTMSTFGLEPFSCPSIASVYGGSIEGRSSARAVASLSDNQRRALSTGGLRFGSLAPEQKAAWEDYVYCANGRIQLQNLVSDPQRGEASINLEPTVLFPNGLPDDLMISDELGSTPAVYFQKSDTERLFEDEYSAGERVRNSASDQTNRWKLFNTTIGQVQCAPANYYNHTITLSLSDQHLVSFTLRDAAVTGKMVNSWQELPADVRDRLSEGDRS